MFFIMVAPLSIVQALKHNIEHNRLGLISEPIEDTVSYYIMHTLSKDALIAAGLCGEIITAIAHVVIDIHVVDAVLSVALTSGCVGFS